MFLSEDIKNIDIKHLFGSILDGMHDWVRVLDIDNNVIFMNNSMANVIGSTAIGQKCYISLGRNTPCENCTTKCAIFDGSVHQKEEIIGNNTYSVLSSPIKNEVGKVVAVVEVLHDITNLVNLKNKILEQNNRFYSELEIARKLQYSLLPKPIINKKIRFSYVYLPCESIGGDFIDIFNIDEDNIGIYIADVSGHGVPAAMLTIFLNSTINKKKLSPAATLKELYEEFNNVYGEQEVYITIFYAIINTKKRILTYSNAGHNSPPILFSEERFDVLWASGTPISNWCENSEYVDKKMEFKTGDRIFFYTDGIIELKNKYNENYGEKRLLNIILKLNLPPDIILNHLLKDSFKFAGIKDILAVPDDITMALLELKQIKNPL